MRESQEGLRPEREMVWDGVRPIFDVAVVIPARNEQSGVGAALTALAHQDQQPGLIIVVVNNTTDRTADVARMMASAPGMPWIDVVEMKSNRWKKAGALNAGITRIQQITGLSLAASARYVLTMDGDTQLDSRFIARAATVLDGDPRLGGVSASCHGRPGNARTLWQRYLLAMQRIEYGRYSDLRVRINVHTMSGAGSFYRAAALQHLLSSAPRGSNAFWEHEVNQVEDYETTLALREHGWRITANQWCIARTDLMPSLRALMAQRERWVAGTVGILRHRGWTAHTWLAICTLIWAAAGYAYTVVWISASARAIWAHDGRIDLRYLLLVAFWSAYQAWTSRHLGWRAVLIEAAVIPESVFGIFRAVWLTRAVVQAYLNSARHSNWATEAS